MIGTEQYTDKYIMESMEIMSKVAVVYWSGTGNTAAMATAVAEGAQEKGAEVSLMFYGEFGAERMDDFDAVAFGCPSMGSEQLEEGDFEPMFTACEGKLAGNKIALFGSYGWGDGEWMRSWEDTCRSDGDRRYLSRITSIGLTPGCNIEVLKNVKNRPLLIYGRDTMID